MQKSSARLEPEVAQASRAFGQIIVVETPVPPDPDTGMTPFQHNDFAVTVQGARLQEFGFVELVVDPSLPRKRGSALRNHTTIADIDIGRAVVKEIKKIQKIQ